jgi:hypothetical protein
MKTLGMKVENIGFLIDRLGRDCAPDQYLRELTQNAIEAIIRSGRSDGRIVWDFVEHGGVRKLCICDNGVGMAGDELVRYINSLSSSGSVQGMDANYGVGAKIAAATRNPEGLVYASWQDGVSAGIQLVKDGSGQYGLLQFSDFRHVFDADRSVLPSSNDVIDDSGTCVILLGNEPNEDTAVGPTAQWIRKYLNTRYFVIPKNMSVQCRAVGKTDTGLRPVNGQKWMLDAAAGDKKGKVTLSNAIAHWWILPDGKFKFKEPIEVDGGKSINSMETFSTAYLHRGHTGLLWKNELYDVQTGNAGYHRLQQFGIFLGVDRVVLYLEPTTGAITTNTARTRLIVDEGDPSWLDWADEFKANMPQELREFIDSIDLNVDRKNDDDAIREKIAAVMDLFQVPKYRRSKGGDESIDEKEFTSPPTPSGNGNGKGASTGGGKKTPRPFFAGPKLNGPSAKKVTVNDLPRIIFKYRENGSRADGEMEDMAANYVETKSDKTLYVNGDFRVFQAFIDRYVKQYPNAAGVRQKVQEIVEKWIKLTLCEVIIGAKALQSEHWSAEVIDQWLTEQTLTLAVMPRVLLNQAVKREIYAALGKPQDGGADLTDTM